MASMALRLLLIVLGMFAINFITYGLAVSAEHIISTAKLGQDSESMYSYCLYDVNVVTILGIAASALLLVGQLNGVVASKCFCSTESLKPGGYYIIVFMVNWITFFLAEAYLLWGTLKNAKQPTYWIIFGLEFPECETRPLGFFRTGAGFILINSMVSKINFVFCFELWFGQSGLRN